MTFAERLSEIGSSTPIMLRLINRQPIGISMVTRLITMNASSPPSGWLVGRSRKAQPWVPLVADRHAHGVGDQVGELRLVVEQGEVGGVEAVDQEVEEDQRDDRRQQADGEEPSDLAREPLPALTHAEKAIRRRVSACRPTPIGRSVDTIGGPPCQLDQTCCNVVNMRRFGSHSHLTALVLAALALLAPLLPVTTSAAAPAPSSRTYRNPLAPRMPGDGTVDSCADPTVLKGQRPGAASGTSTARPIPSTTRTSTSRASCGSTRSRRCARATWCTGPTSATRCRSPRSGRPTAPGSGPPTWSTPGPRTATT